MTLLITASVGMLFSSINLVSAEDVIKKDSPLSAVEGFISDLNKNNYTESINYWIGPKQQEYSSFIKNEESEGTGLLGIEKARLVDYKELDYTSAQSYTPYFDNLTSNYKDVHFYYIAVDYKVAKENEMNMDGINYVLTAVVLENGHWKIAQYSVAPVDNIVSDKNGLNTADEATWVKQYKERYKGKYIDRKDRVIKINKTSEIEQKEEKALKELTEPSASTEFSAVATAVDPLSRPGNN
jgi:hypothetical protein